MPDSIVGVEFDYTYNGVLSQDVLFKPSVATPAIGDLMTIRQFARYQERIPLVAPLEKQVKAYADCGRSFTDGVDITNQTLSLTPLELNMEWCKDDFEQTLLVGNNLAEEMLRNGVEEFNPSGTQIQTIIDELVSNVMRRDTFRIFSFADTSYASADYNQLDGMWPQLIANSGTGGSYCVTRTSTPLGTGTLADGAALDSLKEAYEESAIILKQIPNNEKYFAVTGSVYENLLSSYESNTTGGERQFLNLVQGQGDGQTSLLYRGIPVLPIYAWDQALQDPENQLEATTKHLILYTTRMNHAAGFFRQEDADRISGWYERKDRKYYVEGFYRMGYTYIHCDLQTIAY
ncbi:MAG: hypothetical protein HRU26_00850 [Psychroserpens sp.]|nr:hypothetical protein [Psychroserpens sp.]